MERFFSNPILEDLYMKNLNFSQYSAIKAGALSVKDGLSLGCQIAEKAARSLAMVYIGQQSITLAEGNITVNYKKLALHTLAYSSFTTVLSYKNKLLNLSYS
ncbi:hypothetical protein EBR43_01040 [bacterium]|nr:hypothetical protein [bacterium]NBW56373.1 hypothetical protein [bacterium]